MITLDPGLWAAIVLAMIIIGIPVASLVSWLAERAALRRRRRTAAAFRTCGPCNGGFGGCTCPGPCGDPHCRHAAGEVGDDTLRMLSEASAEETERAIAALLADMDRGDLA